MLKILLLKIEVAQLHGLLERCRSSTPDSPSDSLLDLQPLELTLGFLLQLAFGKHATKFALPFIVLVASFVWKKKRLQFQELCRKYFMGTEDDAQLGKRLAYGVDILFSNAFLAPGSELWIFSDVPECDREKKLLYGNLNPNTLENIQLVHREGNTVIRRHLESLPLEKFDSILILADEKLEDTVINADSSSLATLLLIRDIQSKRLPLETPKEHQNKAQAQTQSSWIRAMHEASNNTIIISEILDSRTKNLVSVSKIGDYVLSNEFVSMALAMVAEDKQINCVLEELFAEEGNELYIRPAEFYLNDQEVLSFFEIMVRARQREEIVIGYRKASADQAVINPPDKNAPQQWTLQDVFVVLAFE
ncbi:hypothetical protein L7F22_031955 [Adiantum nelumboides]|nr:hypothetical protein [Adiantum nelumboides]